MLASRKLTNLFLKSAHTDFGDGTKSIHHISHYRCWVSWTHGLSTAYHLAKTLKASGKGDGLKIFVVDKERITAGASGIDCGVIRNNYFQPAMRQLMANSVSIWGQHSDLLHYHPVGHMQISPESMHQDVSQIDKEQTKIGYPSQLMEGKQDCANYVTSLFSD